MPKCAPRGSALAVAVPGGSPARTLRCAIAAIGALCAGAGTFVSARAAEAYSADAVKAEFLYRFAGYVEWPGDVPANGSFTIAVTGADGVFEELQRLLPGRSVQNQPITIVKVAVVADLERVQILYVPSRAHQHARGLMAAAVGRPILIVTDEVGGLARGGIVNFVQADRHVRFEVSLTAAERSRLKINAGLLSIAAHVEGLKPRADISCWRTSAFVMLPGCLLRESFALRAAPAGAFLTGTPQIKPEELTAYELGYRGELSELMSLSVSSFFQSLP